ncbi:TenA family protein [Leptolyngbya sp. FACHB-261]|uniref:TenA family protein n=1 Tax=Leptolyngbya sp. FACHB-261 TaxID=2692806 RepID=UPI00168649B1|nr:TenA family protein [Leptolyngbya sp. FACHB-261]MBD2100782.1 TenA family protein [Leptolyngbya sp. FACHB-261]
MSVAKILWQENADLARAILEHRFVQGLGDGTLPRPSFENYIGQDAYFLEAFARGYALALAHSPDREGLYAFAELLIGVTNELRLHASYADRWGVELTDITPSEATLAYTDFLLAIAGTRTIGEICAAMTPCMRLYAFLGQQLAEAKPDAQHIYAEWIHTYSDPSFEALAQRLEDLLDRYTNDGPVLRYIYRRAMQLELGFFEYNS